MASDKELINLCKISIEHKLGWVKSEDWKQRDYEYLSELIYQKTNTLLSVSTLKRIWAEEVKTIPHLNTLNVLAQFAGYDDWFDYKKKASLLALPEKEEFEKKKENLNIAILKRIFSPRLVIMLIMLFGFALSIPYLYEDSPSFNLKNIKFESKKVVSSGIPNSVVFDYNIDEAKFDSAFIQQSWDARMRNQVYPEKYQHTSIYYYPGYHRAKLILNETIVKQHDIHITTNGWLGLVRYRMDQLIPTYLPSNKLIVNGRLFVSEEVLKQNNIAVGEKEYSVSYYNVRDFEGLSGDNFILETEIMSKLDEGALTCQDMMMFIMCENGRQAFSIGEAGCAANLNLKTMDEWVLGRENDLSMFGCDMDKWNKVTYSVKDNTINISLNDKHIYEVSYEKSAGRIIGLHYFFNGTGSVNYVKLLDENKKIVYEDSFERKNETLTPTEFN